MSLDQIRQLLGLVDRDETTCEEVRDLANGHLANVRSKIVDLKRVEAVLAKMLSACSGGVVPDCPVIDALAGYEPEDASQA